MKNKIILIIILLTNCVPLMVNSQGMSNTWLLGNDPGWINFGRIIFDTNSYQLFTEPRKMAFKGTQATISDNQGNFLMSSNGVWIANATNDTIMNGAGLNPGTFVNSFPDGLTIDYGNIFIPFPGDSNKYILFHQTKSSPDFPSNELYYTIVDITLDGGLGAVISKNNIAYNDSISWGIAACKHANGRDWWVVANRDSSDEIIKLLFTSDGINSVVTQSLTFSPWAGGNTTQLTFSPDGTKLITSTYDNPVDRNSSLIIADFNRCTGIFSNTQVLQLTSGSYLWGLAFSPSGEFIFACNSAYVFQINSNTLLVDTVATYDGFISGFPPNCCETSFWNMYLAANGKIYITSGSSVQHLHEMNYPDSAGVTCDVQQHTIALGNYFHLRAVPNHPNYYLGPMVGSPCDTLTSINDVPEHDFKFSISPNPNDGNFRIMYLLPQNEKGKLEVFDVNGKRVFEMMLPQWSTMQNISLPKIGSGVYNVQIVSENKKVNKKLIVFDE